MTDSLGLYLHIPFCKRKCRYCDFYSSFVTQELLDSYTGSLIKVINQWGGKLKNRPIDTIYLGGGTPSLLNHRLPKVINAVRQSFKVTDNCEITLELNPEGDCVKLLENAKKAGITRLSVGVQSGLDDELKVLGRGHTTAEAGRAITLAQELGFQNISVDIMLGLPDSTIETLKKSLDYITSFNPKHISAYMLKIESNTAFGKFAYKLNLPDDDLQADQYLFMCNYLEDKGYVHYEISNFCLDGYESRHNLKYWQGNDYLGIGPAAHSFIQGKRFYYPRDLKAFIKGCPPLEDGNGGDTEEFLMLRLRLKSGLDIKELEEKYSICVKDGFYKKLSLLEEAGFIKYNNKHAFLTDKGMLISNSIITELLESLE